jgi:hypothetical protein
VKGTITMTHLGFYGAYYLTVYGIVGACAVIRFLVKRGLWPHRHDGYVSMNGTVHVCSSCGREPEDLEEQLADVRLYCETHPWCLYAGPDASWRKS